MWQNACLLLWLCSAVAVHGSEAECKKRLDVINPAEWATLREMDINMLSITKFVNVAQQIMGNFLYTHIAWHTADSRTYLQGNSPCFGFGTGQQRGPRELIELERRSVKDIQLGEGFIVILATDGTIWTAGCNNDGSLGNHGTENQPALSQVMGLPPVKKMTVTSSNVIALANNGVMYSWGSSITLGYKSDEFANPSPRNISLAQGSIIPKAIDVCCGEYHCAMVTEDLKVFSWGMKGYIGRPVPDDDTPGLVAGIPEDQHISKVACGERHALAVTATGRLFGWGYNHGGSLMNTEDTRNNAIELDMGSKIIRDVAAGGSTSLVVTDNGKSYFFGQYWMRSWYSPQPTVDHVEFPRDILAFGKPFSPYDEQTFEAVTLGCK